MSPLKYQKQLRLLEARRLMMSTSGHVEVASFRVGYGSPSQFSRGYTRMFGVPPKRDAKQMQIMFGQDHAPASAEFVVWDLRHRFR